MNSSVSGFLRKSLLKWSLNFTNRWHISHPHFLASLQKSSLLILLPSFLYAIKLMLSLQYTVSSLCLLNCFVLPHPFSRIKILSKYNLIHILPNVNLVCVCVSRSVVSDFLLNMPSLFKDCYFHFSLTMFPWGEQISPPCLRNWDSENLCDLVMIDLWQNWS